MRRRQFIALLGGMAAWPLAAHAQHTAGMRRVSVLMSTSATDPYQRENYRAFVQSFEDLGWITGRNVLIDDYWAEGNSERMRVYAQQIVTAAPDAIVVQGSALPAIRQETGAIPIVFVLAIAPATDLARPSGNVTGLILSHRWGASGLNSLRKLRLI